jgi:glycolate oxidase
VNVFHAGDGNIHPILLFDERDPEQIKRVMAASDEILNRCIDLGGSVTGEHGIGVEKISFMSRLFTENDLEIMGRIRIAMNPTGCCSPSKMLPTAGACGMEHIERSHPGKQAHA